MQNKRHAAIAAAVAAVVTVGACSNSGSDTTSVADLARSGGYIDFCTWH